MARYEPPGRGDDPTTRSNSPQSKPAPTAWYRKPVVWLSLVLAILVALVVWGIIALFTGSQGGAPPVTTTTQPPATTSAPTTATTSGGFQLPTLPSVITLPSLPSTITLPSLPSTITLPSLP